MVSVAVAATLTLLAACSGGGEAESESGPEPEEDGPAACEPWAVETIASGQGSLENLLVEDDGALLLSAATTGEVRRLAPDGKLTTVVDGVPNSGGLARDGEWVYVTTGLTIEAANQGIADGTIVRFYPATGERETWATGLVAPNGLALLDDGSAVTTRTLSGAGTPSEVTRVPADDPTRIEPLWSDITRTNGAVVDPTGEWLYVTRVADRAEIWRIATADPTRTEVVADLGDGIAEILDDLTIARDGSVYVTAWASGKVYRVDPGDGAPCEIAQDLRQPTAVEQDPKSEALYATTANGEVLKLTPPGA